MEGISENHLRNLAVEALSRRAGGVLEGNCHVFSKDFEYIINNRFDVTVEVVGAPVGGEEHYVAVVKAGEVGIGSDDGWVIVDATVKQFEEELGVELPNIVILGPDEDWGQYYDYVGIY